MTAAAVLERIRDLPALPQALVAFQTAMQRENVSFDRLAEVISHDQALAARALRLANSSFYGLPGRVNSIRDAIGVLGLRQLSSALTAVAVSGCFGASGCPAFDRSAYWRHSVACGLCAQLIAQELGQDGSAAFTAGLLHDLGRLALASLLPDALSQVYARRHLDDSLLWQAERAVLGIDHSEIGAQAAERWHFGREIVEAIRLHHSPPEMSEVSLVDVVHVADAMVHALDLAHLAGDMVPPLSAPTWNRLKLTPAQCLKVFEHTEASLDEICAALGL
jgi:putative nucleotidyltransferase with HDIG domain